MWSMCHFSMCTFFSGQLDKREEANGDRSFQSSGGDPQEVCHALSPAPLPQSPQQGLQRGRMAAVWWMMMMMVAVTSPQHHTSLLPRASATFHLTHLHRQMDPCWVTSSVFMSLLSNVNGTEGTGICSLSVRSTFSSFFSPATCSTFLKKC